MNLEQTILNHLNKLPLGKQQEVLDFVEFLTTRIDPPRFSVMFKGLGVLR